MEVREIETEMVNLSYTIQQLEAWLSDCKHEIETLTADIQEAERAFDALYDNYVCLKTEALVVSLEQFKKIIESMENGALTLASFNRRLNTNNERLAELTTNIKKERDRYEELVLDFEVATERESRRVVPFRRP